MHWVYHTPRTVCAKYCINPRFNSLPSPLMFRILVDLVVLYTLHSPRYKLTKKMNLGFCHASLLIYHLQIQHHLVYLQLSSSVVLAYISKLSQLWSLSASFTSLHSRLPALLHTHSIRVLRWIAWSSWQQSSWVSPNSLDYSLELHH